jgi:hypothetical protein
MQMSKYKSITKKKLEGFECLTLNLRLSGLIKNATLGLSIHPLFPYSWKKALGKGVGPNLQKH